MSTKAFWKSLLFIWTFVGIVWYSEQTLVSELGLYNKFVGSGLAGTWMLCVAREVSRYLKGA